MKRVTIITGASSGIGKEAARLFAQRGDRIIITARRKERLEELAQELSQEGADVLALPADLADTSQAETLVKTAVERFGRIDALINNAGFGKQERLEKMESRTIEEMVNLNVTSLILLSRAVLPYMKAQGSGAIVNVSSVFGVMAMPLYAVYVATKFAVVGFSKSLRMELKGSGITVSAVCPPTTRTEFFDVAGAAGEMRETLLKYAIPAEKVAACIVKASQKNKDLVFPSFMARLSAFLDKYFSCLTDFVKIKVRDRLLKE